MYDENIHAHILDPDMCMYNANVCNFRLTLPSEKMTVRGTIVRSEVCNAVCFCLWSYIEIDI